MGVGNLRLSYKVMLQDGGKRLGCRYIHEQLNLSLGILSYSVFLISLYIICVFLYREIGDNFKQVHWFVL